MTAANTDPTPQIPELGPLKAPTFVDHVVNAIVSRAALGKILPGNRINELGLARELGISRAPIREALRMLVALGVVENTPYQGMRLAPLTPERVRQINKVRLELEKLSLREVPDLGRAEPLRASLQNIIEDMKTAARKEDRLALANLDADFHETLMKAAGNPVLLKLWQMLRPQLVIIFGLATLKKSLRKVVDEHRTLLAGFGSLSPDKLGGLMEEHILADNLSIDFLSLETEQDAGKEQGRVRGRRSPE
ncbi:MAG TPA: GntR family transcriptional regulator [Steroidobacteraceae bacterium]|nr:GntR family transcriptional regulator [Steroidobacteraceae bacterium]